MKKHIIFLALTLSISCTQNTVQHSRFQKPQGLENAQIVPTDSSDTKIIIVNKPKDIINGSDIIEEVIYIPLETTEESLIGFYRGVYIYNDKIYILDNLMAEEVFIYDMQGKFLKKIGTKGGGPEEYVMLKGMCVDRENGYLMVYDMRKRNIMHYDPDGNFIKKTNVPFLFDGQFQTLPSGSRVMQTSKSNWNTHLGDFDKYRVVYCDTLGNIRKFGLEFDDNANLGYLWSAMRFNEGELILYEQFTNSIYSITDTVIKEKYRIDCRNFTPFDLEKLYSFANNDELEDYWDQKTQLDSYFGENSDHLFFTVSDQKKEYKYFYDKRSGNHIGFKNMNYDTDFMEKLQSNIYAHKDYFIGRASVADLKEMKKVRDEAGNPLSNKMNNMINNLEEEDNDVLVLFKIKQI